ETEKAVEHRGRLAVVLLERGTEDAGEVADFLGDEEVVLHEALDVAEAGMRGIAEADGHAALEVEGKPLFAAAGHEVQVAAYRPQEILGFQEAGELGTREDAGLDQIFGRAGAIEIFGDPEERLQIAEPAFAVLDVRLDLVARG